MSTRANKGIPLKPPSAIEHAGAEARSLLKQGTLYDGIVLGLNKSGNYTLDVHTPKSTISNAVLAAGLFGGLLGHNVSTILAPGTEVKFIYGSPSWIICCAPSGGRDRRNGSNRSAVWGESSGLPTAGRIGGANIPEDLLEGESEIANLFGVAMRFLTTVIQMNAGDRAKVECFLIQDMVRIVSEQWRHVSGMGEDLIFDMGRPGMERSWSSYRHEVLGALKDSDKYFQLKGDTIDKDAIDRINLAMRARFLEYVGFAGDFISSFVCDPPEAIQTLSDAASGRRAGKSWFHRGMDGSMILQSTSNIRLERVTRIPVPHRIASHEDPKITIPRNYRALEKELLQTWDYGTRDEGDAYHTAYQLRAHGRRLTRMDAMARFLQLDKEYDLQPEDTYPEPDPNNVEDDRQAANSDSSYEDAYAVITIMQDGSIMAHDGYGSTIMMSNGDVQISASRNLHFEAAGDIRLVAGGSLFIRARRNIDLQALSGKLTGYAYAGIKWFAERGSLWLRSDADPDKTDKKYDDGPDPEILEHAVYIETTAGKMGLRSAKQMLMQLDGRPDDPDDRTDQTADFVVSTKGNFRVKADGYLIMAATKDVILSASRGLATYASKWYGRFQEIDWSKKIFFRPSSGQAEFRRLQSSTIEADKSIRGPKVGPIPVPGAQPPVGQHHNHIQIFDDPIDFDEGDDSDVQDSLDFANKPAQESVAEWKSLGEGPKWQFESKDEYYWDASGERQDTWPQSLTQQHLEQDSPTYFNGPGYDVWTWSGDRLTGGVRLGDHKQGWGAEAKEFISTEGENTHAPSSMTPDQLPRTASWTPRQISFRFLKRS